MPKDDRWRASYNEPPPPNSVDLPMLPEGWCWASPGQVFAWSSGEFLPKKSQHGGSIPVIGGNGVSGFHDHALIGTIRTLVVGRVGANCGNIHITDGPAWVTDNAIFASDGTSLVVLPYWRLAMSLENLNSNAGGTGQPYVNQAHLNDLVIALPPEAEQRRIVAEVETRVSMAEHTYQDVRRSAERCARLRQSILKWGFQGQLVDQDPTDEPAPALLERIRPERVWGNEVRPSTRAGRGTRRTESAQRSIAELEDPV